MPTTYLGISLVLGFAVSFWGTTGVQENIRAQIQVGPELETAPTPIYLCLSLVGGEFLQAEVGVKGTPTFPPTGLVTARGLRLAPQVCALCMAQPWATAHMQLLNTGF